LIDSSSKKKEKKIELSTLPNRRTSFGPQLQNKNKCALLEFSFSVLYTRELNFGQTIWQEEKLEDILP
jgi:hypothetical protein